MSLPYQRYMILQQYLPYNNIPFSLCVIIFAQAQYVFEENSPHTSLCRIQIRCTEECSRERCSTTQRVVYGIERYTLHTSILWTILHNVSYLKR